MSDGSSIEWCDATWQPVVGCTRVSAGCDNCYAINTVHRFRKADGLTKLRPKTASRPGLDWSGKVALQPERLADPLKWRKPRRVFVCSQADLFHDAVPFEFIAAVFGVMAAAPQHTFLVLTKRPERAREFFAWLDALADNSGSHYTEVLCRVVGVDGDLWERTMERTGLERDLPECEPWPLANVHLGTSVEDQATADARIPALLECPAALHWVSAEPLLGPVDLVQAAVAKRLLTSSGRLRWVVVGGESGPRARPFAIDWARMMVSQCQRAGVPVFVKQLGSKPVGGGLQHRTESPIEDYSGGDMAEWPNDLRIREIPA